MRDIALSPQGNRRCTMKYAIYANDLKLLTGMKIRFHENWNPLYKYFYSKQVYELELASRSLQSLTWLKVGFKTA